MKKIIFCMIIMLSMQFIASAAELPNIANSDVVLSDGEIFDTTAKGYTESGKWSNSGIGFNVSNMKVSTDKNAKASWQNSVKSAYYEVFYWNAVVEGGDKNANVYVYATGNSTDNVPIDFSEGIAQWKSLGYYFTSDGNLRIEVTGSGEGAICATGFRIVQVTQEEYRSQNSNPGIDDIFILKIDSDKAFFNGEETKLDMGVPMIRDGRTMLPVRFVTEKLGAKVNWIEEEKLVDIMYEGTNVKFYIDNSQYMIGEQRLQFDTVPIIIGDRTYIPARALAEAVDKNIYWNEENRIVVISEEEISEKELTDYSNLLSE